MENNKTYIVNAGSKGEVRFSGAIIAFAEKDTRGTDEYGSPSGLLTTLILYRTQGGKFVCERIAQSAKHGVADRLSGAVCDTSNQVRRFFGQGILANELYKMTDFSVLDIE
jgi:hypothetical protein